MDELEKMIKEINVEETLKEIDEIWNDNLEEFNNFRY